MLEQQFTVDEILELEFKKKRFGGLDPEEVDDALDKIIEDYEYFISKINELKKTNEELRNENFRVKMNVLKTATNTLDLDGEDEELSEASELIIRKRPAKVQSSEQVFQEPVAQQPVYQQPVQQPIEQPVQAPVTPQAQPVSGDVDVQDALKKLMEEIEELKKSNKQ